MNESVASTFENVHKLLRIVWVYVENECKEKVKQGTLPEELAERLGVSGSDLNDMNYKVDLPETEVYAALEKLLSIFNDVYDKTGDEMFQPPPEWQETNPCRDARPRFRH